MKRSRARGYGGAGEGRIVISEPDTHYTQSGVSQGCLREEGRAISMRFMCVPGVVCVVSRDSPRDLPGLHQRRFRAAAATAVVHCCVPPRIIVWHARSVSTHDHPVTFVAPRPYLFGQFAAGRSAARWERYARPLTSIVAYHMYGYANNETAGPSLAYYRAY